MIRKLMKRLNNAKGFTLVELLAVIVILGIIAAIAVPSIGNILSDTKVNALEQTRNQIIDAARLQFTMEDISETSVDDLLDKDYLETVPTDPTNNDATITGTITKTGNTFTTDLKSGGEDGNDVEDTIDGVEPSSGDGVDDEENDTTTV